MGDSECNGKITYSDIYKGLWECRDFELEHYWQRAVFLTAFLLACYAGYGTLIIQCVTAEKMQLPFQAVNGVAFVICMVGVLLSLLWIMMAKGSKAWYEKYESAISAFVERYKEKGAFEDDLGEIAGFGIMWCDEFVSQTRSDWLWNAFGGRYSVSRINVAIGHLSTLIWTGLVLLHISVIKSGVGSFAELGILHWFFSNVSIMCACAVIALLLFWIYIKLTVKSAHLD